LAPREAASAAQARAELPAPTTMTSDYLSPSLIVKGLALLDLNGPIVSVFCSAAELSHTALIHNKQRENGAAMRAGLIGAP
jgi:hypothetical protein